VADSYIPDHFRFVSKVSLIATTRQRQLALFVLDLATCRRPQQMLLKKEITVGSRYPDKIYPEFWGLVIRNLMQILDKFQITRPPKYLLLQELRQSVFSSFSSLDKGPRYPEFQS